MLVEVYKEVLTKDTRHSRHHVAILGILLHMDAPEALDTVFSLLDYSDVMLGADIICDANTKETFREMITNVILNPKPNANRAENYKPVKEPQQLRKKFAAYENPKLSTKNNEFLERARAVIRAEEEQNTNVDTPLP